MRRALALMLVPAAVVAGVVAIKPDGQAGTFRVDVVFDSAKGMVAGQNVEIAGTRVGTVDKVRLISVAPTVYRAVMQLRIDRRFAPFHADASCRILPQGLISENYVDCSRGSGRDPLSANPQGVPTIPVSSTSVPASLQDVLSVFSVPTSQRLRVLINELGIGTAGRGRDINALLRRANPALTQADRVLSILDGQRSRLAAATADTDRVLSALADDSRAVRGFVNNAAVVASTTAQRRRDVQRSVRLLPPMLEAVRASLDPVRRATRAAAPLLDDLRTAAPALRRLNEVTPVFVRHAVPALRAVSAAADTGRRAIPPATPVIAHLTRLAATAKPVAGTLDDLMANLRSTGGFEQLLKFFYSFANATAGYDATSHFITGALFINPRCILANIEPGTQVEPGCSHAYTAPGLGQIPATQVPAGGGRKAKDRPSDRASMRAFLDYLLG